MSAFNAGGSSAESPEVLLAMPAAGACDVPPAPALTTGAWGNFLTASWTPVPGAVAYLLSAAGPGGLNAVVPFGGGTTSFIYPGLPVGTWNFGIQAQFGCGALSAPGASVLTVDGASLRMQPRAPDQHLYGSPGLIYLDEVIARHRPARSTASCSSPAGSTAATTVGCSVWFARCANATSAGG